MPELTKDADKLVCSLYKLYLSRRKDGFDKVHARQFSLSDITDMKPFDSWSENDIIDTLRELSRAGFGRLYISGSFIAHDAFVIYMESRFKNGLNEVTDFISKFIP